MGATGEKRLVRRYVSLEMERRYPSNNQSRGMTSRRGEQTSSVPMPMRTGANSTVLGPPQREERMEEQEIMTDFSQIFSTNLDFPAITSCRIIFYKASIVQW